MKIIGFSAALLIINKFKGSAVVFIFVVNTASLSQINVFSFYLYGLLSLFFTICIGKNNSCWGKGGGLYSELHGFYLVLITCSRF